MIAIRRVITAAASRAGRVRAEAAIAASHPCAHLAPAKAPVDALVTVGYGVLPSGGSTSS
jgi:hypothetical protein